MKDKSLNAMKNQKNLANKIWEIAYPVLMYYAAITIGIYVAQMFLGTGNENYMTCKIIGSLVAIPIVWNDYKADLKRQGVYGKKPAFSLAVIKNILIVSIITVFLSIAVNNILCMSPLVEVSEEFQNASNAFYGSTIGLEILGSAMITPFLEELLHRGVVYPRLRKMMELWPAVIVSALIFAFLHFNIVQFIYAFLLGIVFALFVEKTNKLYPAVVAHMVANAIAVIRTETGFLNATVDKSASAWLLSVGFLLIGIGCLFLFGFVGAKKNKEA